MSLLAIVITTFTVGSLWDPSPLAQSRPSFSGTWTLVLDATARSPRRPTTSGDDVGSSGGGELGGVGGGAFWCGAECTISHAGDTLSIRRHVPGQTSPAIVLKLDGTDSKITQAGREGGPPTHHTAKARWDGSKLIVTRSLDPQGRFTTIQVVSIENEKLTLVTTHTVDGTTPEGARPRVLTYTKK
jgi:hypothetical protein